MENQTRSRQGQAQEFWTLAYGLWTTLNYPVFFLPLSTWTWDTFLTLRGTWGFYLNHVLPPRPSKSYGVVECASGYVVMCKLQAAMW